MNKQLVKEKLDHSSSILRHSCVKQRGEDTKDSKRNFPLNKVYLSVEHLNRTTTKLKEILKDKQEKLKTRKLNQV